MGSKMQVNEEKMLNYFEKLMDQIYLQFHVHPTNLTHANLSQTELTNFAATNRIPQQVVRMVEASPEYKVATQAKASGGAKVVTIQRADTSNGISRKR